MPLYKPTELNKFLKDLGVEPKKGLSQNFLIDGNILNKLIRASAVQKGDTVLEIGPGPGVLTEALLKTGASVVAIEKDETLANHLKRLDNGKLKILIDDFRNIHLKRLLKDNQKFKVIANIPYSITGLVIRRLLPLTLLVHSIHLMVQKEVAERCVAKVQTKDYSSFTLFVNYHAQAKYLFTVPRTCFHPKPKVDSAIIEFILQPPPVEAPYEPLFEMIQAAFQQRRKMLRSSLKTFAKPNQIEETLAAFGHKKTARPQELSLTDFSNLWLSLSHKPLQ